MKTYRIEQPGSLDGLVVREESIPEPGAGQVLVKVKATATNYRDTFVLNGVIPGMKADVIPLSDAAGEIVSVGPDVRRFVAGDRVLNTVFTNWVGGPYNFAAEQFTVEHDGWLTEYKVVDAETLLKVPDHLSFEEAAALVCTGTTAWTALKGVSGGDTVLTLGSGSVSLFAIQFAKAQGAKVIATTSSDEKAALLKTLGADHVINYVTTPEWGEQVRALTDGRGVERVVEVGGSATMPESIKAVALGGQVSVVGVLGGFGGSIDFMALFMSHASFQPIPVGSRTDLADALRVVAQHEIHPVIDRVFPFDEAKHAMAHAATAGAFGKIIIRH